MAKRSQQEMLSPDQDGGWDKPTAEYVGDGQESAYVTPFLFVGQTRQYHEFCRSVGFQEAEVRYVKSLGDLFGRKNTLCFVASMNALIGFDFKASKAFDDYVESHNIRRIRV